MSTRKYCHNGPKLLEISVKKMHRNKLVSENYSIERPDCRELSINHCFSGLKNINTFPAISSLKTCIVLTRSIIDMVNLKFVIEKIRFFEAYCLYVYIVSSD